MVSAHARSPKKVKKMARFQAASMLMYYFRRKRKIENENYHRRLQNGRRERLRNFQLKQRKEMGYFLVYQIITLVAMEAIVRSTWSKQRSSTWWDKIVNETFEDKDWVENFRMRKETFNYLCHQLRPSIKRKTTIMRSPIPVEKRVAITLWRLATNSGYRTIGHLFGVARNTVCNIVNEVCKSIVRNMHGKVLKWPTGEILLDNIEHFERRWGFPQTVGAVDGTHIPILRPSEYHTDYYNRKGYYSMIMQAVVDSYYRFIDIYIGWPGRVHDARVFANSPLFKKACDGTLLPHKIKNINGVNVPLLILGDPAYPLMPWLMKPFSDNGRLNDDQRRFNYRLSRARMVVENSFGRLKGRWRILLKRLDASESNITNLVAACCILHNLCEKWGEQFLDEWLNLDNANNEGVHHMPRELCDENNESGIDIRNALVQYLKSN